MPRAPWVLAACALLAACDANSPVTPSDAPIALAVTHNSFRDVVDEEQVLFNECTGEDVLLQVKQLFLLREVAIEGKFFHGHITFLDRGTTGEGLTSGNLYRQTGAEQEFLHLKGEVGVSQRIHVTLNLVGKGQVPNLLVHEILRVNISQDGVVTLAFDKVRSVCKG